MKRYTLYTFPALALLLAAAACTQDDAVLLPEAPEGIPMTFTAKGLNPTAATTTGTRATVDGDWTDAVTGMNNAFTGNDYQWKLGENNLPVLQKKQ